MPRRDVLPVELGRDSTWSPLWYFERPYIIVVASYSSTVPTSYIIWLIPRPTTYLLPATVPGSSTRAIIADTTRLLATSAGRLLEQEVTSERYRVLSTMPAL